MTSRKRQHRVRDFVLYIGISFAVVAVVIIAALTGFGHGWGEWIAIAITTSVLFYYWLKICRSVWRLSFWLITLLLLAAHLSFWAAVMKRFGESSVWYLFFTVPFELALFAWCADLLDPLFHHKNLFKGVPRP